jgi:hypothetical protein
MERKVLKSYHVFRKQFDGTLIEDTDYFSWLGYNTEEEIVEIIRKMNLNDRFIVPSYATYWEI